MLSKSLKVELYRDIDVDIFRDTRYGVFKYSLPMLEGKQKLSSSKVDDTWCASIKLGLRMIYIFIGLPLSSQYKHRGIEATQPDSKRVQVSLI